MSSNPDINVDVSTLKVGEVYFRKYLAELWHYKGEEGLHKGIVTVDNSNIILLFTTLEKQKNVTQYEDVYKDGILLIDGQEEHKTDFKVMEPNKIFYSFYRRKSKIKNKSVPFTYQGEARIIREKCIIRKKKKDPSKFCFKILADCPDDKIDTEIDKALSLGMDDMSEGTKKLVKHMLYERNAKVRAEALKIHPHRCEVCGFDFDRFYGKDVAEGYIEIHHIKPISKAGVREVNPAIDLIPVCANCHRMIHHHRDRMMTLDELKEMIQRNKS